MSRRKFAHIPISHPDVEGTGYCHPSALPVWEANGWHTQIVEEDAQPEWTAYGLSDQEGDDEPDADEESDK